MSMDERAAAMHQKEGMKAIAEAIKELAKAVRYAADANKRPNV